MALIAKTSFTRDFSQRSFVPTECFDSMLYAEPTDVVPNRHATMTSEGSRQVNGMGSNSFCD